MSTNELGFDYIGNFLFFCRKLKETEVYFYNFLKQRNKTIKFETTVYIHACITMINRGKEIKFLSNKTENVN